jgi:Amt family ammonium transporter
MTLPGLALFYGGLVRKKNVLSVLAQCMGIAGSSPSSGGRRGTASPSAAAMRSSVTWGPSSLKGVEAGKTGAGYHWISDMHVGDVPAHFAIITPALIVGAIAERMKFSAVLLFVALWMFVVYFPFAHMVWAGSGLHVRSAQQGCGHQGD